MNAIKARALSALVALAALAAAALPVQRISARSRRFAAKPRHVADGDSDVDAAAGAQRCAGLSCSAGAGQRGARSSASRSSPSSQSHCKTRSRWRCSRIRIWPSRPRISGSRSTASCKSKARTMSRCTCSRNRTFRSILRRAFSRPVPANSDFTPRLGPTTGPGNIIQHQSATGYGASGQTESGTSYQADIEQSRTYNNTLFNAYNPQYLATLNLSVTQPLLKNFGMNATKRQLKLAIVNADAGVAQTLIDASNAISQVEDTYWNLVAAWRNVAIQEDALHEAIAQQASNVRLAQRGAAAPIDAVESQTQVSNFQDQVFQALHRVSQLQNELKSLIAGERAGSGLGREPRPVNLGGGASQRRATSTRSSPRRGRIARRFGKPKTGACRPRSIAPMRRISRCRKRTFRRSTSATVLPDFLHPCLNFYQAFALARPRRAVSVCLRARRRRQTRKVRWPGPITTCGPAIFRRSTSR